MFKGGPLLPINFKTENFSEKEKETWKWYTQHMSIVSIVILEGNSYGFSRLGKYKLITPMGTESECDRGTWLEYKGTLCVDKEELRYYV